MSTQYFIYPVQLADKAVYLILIPKYIHRTHVILYPPLSLSLSPSPSPSRVISLYGARDKVSMLTHIYPHEPRRKIEVTICKITRLTAQFLWPDVCSGNLQVMTPNVLTETMCH